MSGDKRKLSREIAERNRAITQRLRQERAEKLRQDALDDVAVEEVIRQANLTDADLDKIYDFVQRRRGRIRDAEDEARIAAGEDLSC